MLVRLRSKSNHSSNSNGLYLSRQQGPENFKLLFLRTHAKSEKRIPTRLARGCATVRQPVGIRLRKDLEQRGWPSRAPCVRVTWTKQRNSSSCVHARTTGKLKRARKGTEATADVRSNKYLSEASCAVAPRTNLQSRVVFEACVMLPRDSMYAHLAAHHRLARDAGVSRCARGFATSRLTTCRVGRAAPCMADITRRRQTGDSHSAPSWAGLWPPSLFRKRYLSRWVGQRGRIDTCT